MFTADHEEEYRKEWEKLKSTLNSTMIDSASDEEAIEIAIELLSRLPPENPLFESVSEILGKLRDRRQLNRRLEGMDTFSNLEDLFFAILDLENLLRQGINTYLKNGRIEVVSEKLTDLYRQKASYLRTKTIEYVRYAKLAFDRGSTDTAFEYINRAAAYLEGINADYLDDEYELVQLEVSQLREEIISSKRLSEKINEDPKWTRQEKLIIDDLIQILKGKDIKVLREVTVGNTTADIFAQTKNGATAIFHIFNWDAIPINQLHASNLALVYKKLALTDHSIVVLPGTFESKDASVLSIKNVPDFIENILLANTKKAKMAIPEVYPKPQKTIFVAMPFSEKYFDTFVIGIESACVQVGVSAVRVDHTSYTGDIVDKIKLSISHSVAVIADISESKPNVLYEIGYAHALSRPVIQICSTPLEELPFDIRNNRTIQYKIGQTAKLQKDLIEELKLLFQ